MSATEQGLRIQAIRREVLEKTERRVREIGLNQADQVRLEFLKTLERDGLPGLDDWGASFVVSFLRNPRGMTETQREVIDGWAAARNFKLDFTTKTELKNRLTDHHGKNP